MALPISTTKHNLTETFGPPTAGSPGGTKWRIREQHWFTQAKPYDRPLGYHSREASVTSTSDESGASPSFYRAAEYSETSAYSTGYEVFWGNSLIDEVYNKAYSKLIGKIKPDSAEIGAALAERIKTAEMVVDRVRQMATFARAVSRGRFGDANRALRIPSGFKPKARALGGVWLEYSFGWAPTVGDIHNGMKILTSGIPPLRVKAMASSAVAPYTTVNFGVIGSGNAVRRYITGGDTKVTAGCGILLTNPNLWLANQLGLINPAAVAWELVPFSFVVDYFGNIGDVINSWSDFIGVEIIFPYRSFVAERTSVDYEEYGVTTPPGGSPKANYRNVVGKAYRMHRQLLLPGPTLRGNAPKVSLRRASTSIALLLQLLRGR